MQVVQHSKPLDKLLQTFGTVFSQGELGCLKGQKFTLSIKPDCVPKFYKPRVVPFVIKKKVETELCRLQELGVISPISYSDWAAPIVPIVKRDGSVRICGDFKVTSYQY